MKEKDESAIVKKVFRSRAKLIGKDAAHKEAFDLMARLLGVEDAMRLSKALGGEVILIDIYHEKDLALKIGKTPAYTLSCAYRDKYIYIPRPPLDSLKQERRQKSSV
jgi:hypothetical protein